MPGIASVPKKGLLIWSFGKATAQHATIEPCEKPRRTGLPEGTPREKELDPEGLKLTMPDGSEWYIEDWALGNVLESARESREYLRAAKDGGED